MDIDVIYKDIKNLHIGVYPPKGRVRVAAPRRLDEDQVRHAVIQRLPWIRRQQAQLRSAERQSEREMVNGESHFVEGVRYRLRRVEGLGRAHFEIDGGRLVMYVPAGTTPERRRSLLDQWYRQRLRAKIPDLIAGWEPKLGISVTKWSIRRMKTKWGSCNRETGHIWLNVELAKKHPDCVEYVLVHEMTHYLERNHTERFTRLMDSQMPDWRHRRERLNAAPMPDEDW